jgi:hypothetical protein
MRSPRFNDALVLMASNVRASGEGTEALARWRAREAEIQGTSAPKSEGPAEPLARRPRPSRRTPNEVALAAAVGVEPELDTVESFTFEASGLL